MNDDLDWIKSKLFKMEVMDRIPRNMKKFYEQMGLIETPQIKSIEMYGHKKENGSDIVYNPNDYWYWR